VFPRFTPEAREANLALVDLLKQIAKRKNATPAQVALAWLLAQKPWIVPIPGTTKLHRLEENLGSVGVDLTTDDLRDIETSFAKIPVEGARLPEQVLRYSNG
jgi:aryl-alcohol dehydrogenase-like predicted oxidoreductase